MALVGAGGLIGSLLGCGAPPAEVVAPDAREVTRAVAPDPLPPTPGIPPTGDIPVSPGLPRDRDAAFNLDDLALSLGQIYVDSSKEQVTRRRTGTTWELQYLVDREAPPSILLQSGAYIAETEEAAARAYTAIGLGAENGADDDLQLVPIPDVPGWGSAETCAELRHGADRVGWYCWSQKGRRVGMVMLFVSDPAFVGRFEPFPPKVRAAFERIDRWTP